MLNTVFHVKIIYIALTYIELMQLKFKLNLIQLQEVLFTLTGFSH